MSKKIKIITISDHPLSPSGVGTQTKYVCEALLKSGKFEILSLGGAMKHRDYPPITVDPHGQDWRVVPVDGYGTQEMVRSIIRNEKPDAIWIMTDPRFYEWLWAIENEIRALCPIVYYHVWDNYPYPEFNQKYYESNDHIACISKLTHDIVRNVAPNTPSTYLPHAVDPTIFRPMDKESRLKLREENVDPRDKDKFIVFWNNRNARRKQSGTLIWWFSEWLDKRGLHDKAQLLIHTDPRDPHGQDLEAIIQRLGLTNREVLLSVEKVTPEQMAIFYNLVDVTVNISDAEGFGLSTLESLASGTPIIANMTGGLQEQVVGADTFGVPLFPVSKAIIGSQSVPYIYEDRLSKDHFMSALSNMYDLGIDGRLEMGLKGAQHVQTNYNFNDFGQKWVDLMLEVHESQGSWDSRNHNTITFKEVA